MKGFRVRSGSYLSYLISCMTLAMAFFFNVLVSSFIQLMSVPLFIQLKNKASSTDFDLYIKYCYYFISLYEYHVVLTRTWIWGIISPIKFLKTYLFYFIEAEDLTKVHRKICSCQCLQGPLSLISYMLWFFPSGPSLGDRLQSGGANSGARIWVPPRPARGGRGPAGRGGREEGSCRS